MLMWLDLRRWLRGRRSREPDPDNPFDLDTPLLRFSLYDIWTFRDACESVQIFGASGGGKTSGSGKAIGIALLRRGCSGLVLCAKPSERELWEDYARQTGRTKDLIIVSPENPYRFNWLDYELRREGKGAGQTENLVTLFSQIADFAAGRIEQSGGGDPFWTNGMKELVRNSIGLLALSKETLCIENIYRLIAEAPQNLAEAAPKEAAPKSKLNDEVDKTSREYRNW